MATIRVLPGTDRRYPSVRVQILDQPASREMRRLGPDGNPLTEADLGMDQGKMKPLDQARRTTREIAVVFRNPPPGDALTPEEMRKVIDEAVATYLNAKGVGRASVTVDAGVLGQREVLR